MALPDPALSDRDERVLVALSHAADRGVPGRLERVAETVLDRDDAAARLVRAVAASDWPAWTVAREIVLRREGDGFGLLDLSVEVVSSSLSAKACRGHGIGRRPGRRS